MEEEDFENFSWTEAGKEMIANTNYLGGSIFKTGQRILNTLARGRSLEREWINLKSSLQHEICSQTRVSIQWSSHGKVGGSPREGHCSEKLPAPTMPVFPFSNQESTMSFSEQRMNLRCTQTGAGCHWRKMIEILNCQSWQ